MIYKAPESNEAPLKDMIVAYVNRGEPVGGFLMAVLSNNLYQAFARADDINQMHMLEYAKLLNDIPMICWGSEKKVRSWIKTGGLHGHSRSLQQDLGSSEIPETS